MTPAEAKADVDRKWGELLGIIHINSGGLLNIAKFILMSRDFAIIAGPPNSTHREAFNAWLRASEVAFFLAHPQYKHFDNA